MFGKALNFLVYSNIYLSFGASVVAWFAIFIMKLPLDFGLLFIPFAGGMLIYNLNRQTDTKEDTINVPERIKFVHAYGKYFIGAGLVMYLIALYFALLKGISVLLVAILPVVIASFYSIKRLKKLFFLKNAIVGVSWGITPLLVGFYNQMFGMEFVIISAFFAISFFVNTIIFDIKDVVGDISTKIETIPVKLGIEKTKIVCYVSNFVTVITLLISVAIGILPLISLVLLLFACYIFFYIKEAQKKKGSFFYGVLVDGEFIFLFFITLALTILQV